jgi:ATP-binding cassette subfamily C protein CydD/ATP-binding cassette subfamily C protein CydCD
MRPFDPRLLRSIPEARRPMVLLAVVGTIQGIATIATAFALAHLAVAVVRGQSLGEPAAYLLGLFVIRGILAFVGERVAASGGVAVSTALRRRLVSRWLSLPAEERPEPGVAVTLATQGTTSVEPYAARFLPALVTAAVVPALALVALVAVDWVSALVVVLTLPLLPVFAALIGAATRDETQRRWSSLAGLSGHFLDVMRGLPTLVGYGRAERQVDTIAEVSRRHRRATMATLRLAFLSSAALELLATICVAIVAVFVGLRLAYGSMELLPGLVAILLAPEAYWPVRRVGAEFHSAADGTAALESALDDLEASTPAPARTPATSGTVVVNGLGYTYPGSSRAVLDGVDLEAGPGLTVVTGESGVGKSTLLELVAGLRTPDAGTIEAPEAHLVSQRPFLMTGTVRANLTLGQGRPVSEDEQWTALRAVALDSLVEALPHDLDETLGDDGRGLSAGQRARLVLARALLSDAPLVLLDEPTAHLDDSSVTLAHKAIRDLAATRTVIAVTHRPELVALADHHVHLRAHATTRHTEEVPA